MHNPARRPVAPTTPSRAYICLAKSGKMAANAERRALLAAIADAAMGRYAVTRYVKTDWKMRSIPMPKGMEPKMMGRIQGMEDGRGVEELGVLGKERKAMR